MIRLLDSIVADWNYHYWICDGEQVKQVMVHLFNGMTFVMDEEDFLAVTDIEAM